MKGWHIGFAVIVAVIVLMAMQANAQALLNAWPAHMPSPVLHVACGAARGRILLRVELGGYVAKDYLIECEAV